MGLQAVGEYLQAPEQRWVRVGVAIAAAYVGRQAAVYAYRRWCAPKRAPRPPSPPAHPVLQHIPLVSSIMKEKGMPHFDIVLEELMKRYPHLGRMFVLKLVALDLIVVCDPAAVKEIIITQNYKKSDTYKPYAPVFGAKSLVMLTDEAEWARHRRAFNPGFTPQFLRETAVPVFVRKAQEMIPRLQSAADTGSVIEMHTQMVLLTLDVICMVTFSKDFGFTAADELPPLYNKFITVLNSITWYDDRPQLEWMKWLPWEWWRLYKEQRDYDRSLLAIIQERLSQASSGDASVGASQQLRDILGLAINVAQQEKEQQVQQQQVQQQQQHAQGKQQQHKWWKWGRHSSNTLSARDFLDEIKSFLVAGHETSATIIAFAVYEISINAEVQRKVLEEVDRVCGRAEAPTANHLSQLEYLGAVIKETLRMWPPGGTGRMAPKGTVINGYEIGGTALYITHRHVQRDPHYWGHDAHEFKPERWLDEAYVTALHPCAYMPFSKGPRDCIGKYFADQEIRVVLAMLYQHFTFTYAHSQPETIGYHLTTYPFHHVPVTVQRRNT